MQRSRLVLLFLAGAIMSGAALQLAHAAATCADLAPLGLPVATVSEPNAVTVCEQSGNATSAFFITHYDRSRVAPRWVAYSLTRAEMLAGEASGITRKKDGRPFARDPAIETNSFRSPTNSDYNGIAARGFDRGHYAPADAMKWSRDAYRATFTVSNIGLQVSTFNQGVWGMLEVQERAWACEHGTIYSVTGVNFGGPRSSTFRPASRTDLRIAIPTHFWKVVYTPSHGGRTIAFIFVNSKRTGTLQGAIRSVRDIETVTGLDVTPTLERGVQDRIETEEPDTGFWRFDYPKNFACR